jgi:photosystem II stability/assembly factor-like uncharacterized protein
MKKLSFVLLLAALQAGGAWAEFTAPLERVSEIDIEHALKNRLLSLERAGDRLVAVGRRGHIVVSEDNGESWRQSQAPVASDLVDLFFLDSRLGWAVGHEGVVLRTADAGETWEKVLDGNRAAAIITEFLQENRALSEEQRMELERFAEEGTDKPFLSVHFKDPNNGFVIGAFNLAFGTADGGQTWSPISPLLENPFGYHLYSVFGDGNELYVTGEKGLLLRWDGDAQRFAAFDSPYEGTWFGGLALDGRVLLYGMRGTVFYGSPASGWERIDLGMKDTINSAVQLDSQTALLVTQSGRVFRLELPASGAEAVHEELKVDRRSPLYDLELADQRLVLVGARGVKSLTLDNE